VVATVTGVPAGSSGVLTATANGSPDFRPDASSRDACTMSNTDAGSTVWTCTVTGDLDRLGFVVNAEQGRDVTFEVSPVAPLTDPNPDNNLARVHWDPRPKTDAALSNESPASLALRRRHSAEHARATDRYAG
jgi:hypothetical protein